MRNPNVIRLVSLVIATMAAPLGLADDTESLVAYFPFENSAGDASGAKVVGQLIGDGGVAATDSPEYVDAKFGRAVRFNGGRALRVPLDLDPGIHPKLSITGWVFFEDIGEGCDVIVSTGDGDGPSLARCGRALELGGGDEPLRVENALSPSQWNFVAGVWDYEAGAARLHWRTRSADGDINTEELAVPEPDFWIGAHNDTLNNAAKGVRIDELRIYSKALDNEDISGVRESSTLLGRLTPAESSGASAPLIANPVRVPSRDILSNKGPLAGRHTETGSDKDDDEEQKETSSVADAGRGTPLVVTPILELKNLEILRRVEGGQRKLSSLAGNRGNIIKEVDFKDRAIDSILWSEKSDKPCEIGVADRDSQLGSVLSVIYQCANDSVQFACEGTPCTGNAVNEYDAESAVRLAPSQAITAVRLCMNSSGERVKGIEIRGAEILDTGVLAAHTVTDSERKPNCHDKNWGPVVLCPSQQVATGIRAHFKEGKGPTTNIDTLTGLELICRPTKRRSE